MCSTCVETVLNKKRVAALALLLAEGNARSPRGMSDCRLPAFFNESLFCVVLCYTQGSLYSCKMPMKPIGELIKEEKL